MVSKVNGKEWYALTYDEAVTYSNNTWPARNNKRPVFDGLSILYDLYGSEDVTANEYQLWAGPEDKEEINITDIPDDTIHTLTRLGWFIDDSIDRWSTFV